MTTPTPPVACPTCGRRPSQCRCDLTPPHPDEQRLQDAREAFETGDL